MSGQLGFGDGWISPKVGQNALLERLGHDVKWYRFDRLTMRAADATLEAPPMPREASPDAAEALILSPSKDEGRAIRRCSSGVKGARYCPGPVERPLQSVSKQGDRLPTSARPLDQRDEAGPGEGDWDAATYIIPYGCR